ncbi:MAG: PglZ domain-containing protein [Prevotella sp.]|nr:PglZ domain-containing protein [Prevotella sp.]
MTNGLLLWADDEIDLLRGQVIFLEKKGYEVVTVSNGSDAIEECRARTFDLVILDEMMPGKSGLETLEEIKAIQPATPVVMLTKSEEEDIMDEAIGKKIADYLIKPVNPNQILLSLKKNVHRKEIETEVVESGYQQQFMQLSNEIASCRHFSDWAELYRKLIRWEIELSSVSAAMQDLIATQKEEANAEFAKYIKKNYLDWARCATFLKGERPMMSPDIFKTKVFPLLDKGETVFFIMIDNFRYDQWRVLAGEIGDMFDIDEEIYLSILPTATQYSRNAIFSGLMPEEIAKMYPDLWVDEDEDEGKNLNEGRLIETLLQRFRRKNTFTYSKINGSSGAEKYINRLGNIASGKDICVLVVNFIDMLSHAGTEVKMVRELANNESAYRSITLSWFRHSVLADLFKYLAESRYKIVLTTDHGSIRTTKAVKIVGDRDTTVNLRYKAGRSISCESKDVFTIRNPHEAGLPAPNLSTSYVFATGNMFFAYPNNFNYYASFFKNTFQHGGISMEEMLVPVVTLTPRKH